MGVREAVEAISYSVLLFCPSLYVSDFTQKLRHLTRTKRWSFLVL
jgi:hypothetical protein